MRPWAKNVFLQFCFVLLILDGVCGFFGLTARESVLMLTSNLEHTIRELQSSKKTTSVDLCNMLVLQRKQKRQCRGGPGVAETLVRASRLSALECQYQFQQERWNCSLGEYRKHILNRGFKETSFLYAISSAGLVHEISRACAQGLIDRCTCDESKHLKNTETWRWGGCGDNIRFGLQFARKFLREAKRSEKDVRARVDMHNSDVGMRVVKELVNTKCKCHGVSGSCTVKTCWLQLSPFKTVGSVLKTKYEKSVRVISLPNHATGETRLMKKRKLLDDVSMSLEETDLVPLRRTELTYIENSPNFCLQSTYSPGTSGRTCTKGDNCDSICCGRGYNVQRQVLKTNCKCEAIWCCKITCKICLIEKEIYLCK